MNFKHNVNTN